MKKLSNLNKKCGEITFCTQVGKRVYILNCLYCPQICLEWDIYINHMEEEHDEKLNFDHMLQPENEPEFQKDNEKEAAKHISPTNNKLDCPNLSAIDDPLESENSNSGKRLESSIKIENEEYSVNPTIFDSLNNSACEEVEKDTRVFTVNVDPHSLFQNSITNIQEGVNSNFATIVDLNNFRSQFKEELQKTEMRLRNQIKEQPATIKKVLIGVLEDVKLIKSEDTIKTTPKTNVIPAEPFSSIEDFLKYDSEIQNDEDKYLQLVYDFEHQNAKCLQHFVKLNWKKIVNDGAAQHMCWKGTEKKKPVRSLAVTQALKAACDKKYSMEADLNFERICIMHFQHAKGRHEKKLNYKSRVKPTI